MSVAAVSAKWKPYPAYKPSGVDWLGEIPTHWKVKRIKYIAPVVTEKLHEKPEDLPYIGLENVESGTGRLLMEAPVESVDSVVGVFKRGDVLFGKLRPYLAKVVNSSFEGVCTSELVVLRPPTEGGRYLSYQLLSRDLIRLLTSFTYGTKMPRVSPEQIAGLAVAVPPTDEQRTISAFLDRETAKIDALVAKKERLTELLQEKRAALITHAVTKGLNPSNPMRGSWVGWLGDIPTHWQVKRVKWVAKMESGHTPDKKVEAYWLNGDIPWVSLNDTGYLKDHDYISETAYYTNAVGIANSSARLLPPSAVIFSRDATVGLCAITTRPMAVSQHFIAWICGEEVLPEYLLQVFRVMTQELDRLTMGATIKTIGMPDVGTLTTPLPPRQEQEAIVRQVAAGAVKIDSLIAKVREHIQRLREYRSAVISAAVTGKIDVREEAA